MDKTGLGDRIKRYEKEGRMYLDTTLPIVIRLDGNSFSKFTKRNKFKKPFDERMTKAMNEATRALIKYCSHVVVGYTQSDEITLILFDRTPLADRQSSFLSGRVDKICSILASRCSNAFNKSLREQGLDTYADFDCRVFNVPTEVEAMNSLLWRQYDCWKNYVGIVAHTLLNESMHKVTTEEKEVKLLDKGIDVHKDFHVKYHYGTLFYRTMKRVPLPEEFKQYKSNQGKEFIERKEVVEDYFIIKDNRELWLDLINKGYTDSN